MNAPNEKMNEDSAVLLIGSGRLARHLQHWNNLLTEPNVLLCWNRSLDRQLLDYYLNKCSVVWLAISDSAISSFYEHNLSAIRQPIVHFSGAVAYKNLISAHPLMSFPQNLLPDVIYEKIHFVINGCNDLPMALPGFKNKFTFLSSDNKALYHALCVIAGNFPQLLWNATAQQMKELHIPAEALDLYIKQVTENYLLLKEQAITGPLARKDYSTIEKNISSLNQDQLMKLKNIYSSFAKEFPL